MIDEFELSALWDSADEVPPPPLGQVVARGRRLRRRRQAGRLGGTITLALGLVVAVTSALPAPSREIRVASAPGAEHAVPGMGSEDPAPAPDATRKDAKPTAPPRTEPAPLPEDGKPATPPRTEPAPTKGGEPVTTPGTAPTPTTPTTKPDGSGSSPPGHSTVPVTDGKLAGLSAVGLSPVFDPGTAAYTATPDHDVITVTATPADANANLYIQSTKVASGQPFRAWVGDGKHVDIVIYSNWTEIGRYTITVPGQPAPPAPPGHSTAPVTDGNLAGLSAVGLSPSFDPGTVAYTATPDHDVITVTATLADANANLYIQSTKVASGQPFRAWVGDGKHVDIVIYSDWTEIGRYTITRSS